MACTLKKDTKTATKNTTRLIYVEYFKVLFILVDKPELPDGCTKLTNLIERSNGGDNVYPTPPHRILSTDDTTSYVFEGKADEEQTFNQIL